MKLPKQWKHWCADQRLKRHGQVYGKNKSQWHYLQGRGFHWRVNDKGMFQRGDNYEDFDRWALCDIAELPMPRTRAEFRAAVAELLRRSRDA